MFGLTYLLGGALLALRLIGLAVLIGFTPLRSARARACRPSAGDARASERVVSPAVAGVVWLGSGWQRGLGTAAAHVAPASARVIARDGSSQQSAKRTDQMIGRF